jgi:hypothetical protein
MRQKSVSQVPLSRLLSELCDCETEYQPHWIASGFVQQH